MEHFDFLKGSSVKALVIQTSLFDYFVDMPHYIRLYMGKLCLRPQIEIYPQRSKCFGPCSFTYIRVDINLFFCQIEENPSIRYIFY